MQLLWHVIHNTYQMIQKTIFQKIRYSFEIGKACVISDWQGFGEVSQVRSFSKFTGNEAIRKQAGLQYEKI